MMESAGSKADILHTCVATCSCHRTGYDENRQHYGGAILYVEFYKIGQYKCKVLTDDH